VERQRIRIGNQTSRHCPARLPYEFAVRDGFDAFEWFGDKGPWGWCEEDTSPRERDEIRRQARDADMLLSVHAPHAADASTPAAVLRSIRFAGYVGAAVVNLHLFRANPPERFAASLGASLARRITHERTCSSG
jgi:sugar phosphate isomerase/epimerase